MALLTVAGAGGCIEAMRKSKAGLVSMLAVLRIVPAGGQLTAVQVAVHASWQYQWGQAAVLLHTAVCFGQKLCAV